MTRAEIRRSQRKTASDAGATTAAASTPPEKIGRHRLVSMDWKSTFSQAMMGGLLLWAAFPPLGLWPLAWVAPCFWIRLIQRTKLPGRRPYLALYLAGFLHWLILVQWIRLPHWSAYFGWLALAGYLGFYVLLFVVLTRVAVHAIGLPIVFAAPAVWTGLELFRGHFLTGVSIALLGHTQQTWIQLIQIADLFGAYAVSFVVLLVAACLARSLPCERQRSSWQPLAVASAVLACVLAYGQGRLGAEPATPEDSQVVRVALIQGSIDTEFNDQSFDQFVQRLRRIFREYHQLTLEATRQNSDLDLIVWPESMFSSMGRLITYDDDFRPDAAREGSVEEFRQDAEYFRSVFQRDARAMAGQAGTSMLVGTDARHYRAQSRDHFNSALLMDREGKLVGRYDKMHPVMFGEYIPLGNWFPWLYHLTPMSGGLTPGRQPVAMDVGPLRLSPNICFENMVPHLIRRQVAQLKSRGQPPDILVTLTNDGWFWGSSLLDLHLACGRFRAVEMRLPMLIAANTGFSAWIDGSGRTRAVGPRRESGVVVAHVVRDGRQSFYLRWGDWASGLCLLLCVASALWGSWCALSRKFVSGRTPPDGMPVRESQFPSTAIPPRSPS